MTQVFSKRPSASLAGAWEPIPSVVFGRATALTARCVQPIIDVYALRRYVRCASAVQGRVPLGRDALLRAAGSPLSKANAVSQSMLWTTLDWRPFSRLVCTSTNAKVKPAWSGARPVEIPSWLWFRHVDGPARGELCSARGVIKPRRVWTTDHSTSSGPHSLPV